MRLSTLINKANNEKFCWGGSTTDPHGELRELMLGERHTQKGLVNATASHLKGSNRLCLTFDPTEGAMLWHSQLQSGWHLLEPCTLCSPDPSRPCCSLAELM